MGVVVVICCVLEPSRVCVILKALETSVMFSVVECVVCEVNGTLQMGVALSVLESVVSSETVVFCSLVSVIFVSIEMAEIVECVQVSVVCVRVWSVFVFCVCVGLIVCEVCVCSRLVL